MLRIGYKASAEQFAPRELLDFATLADSLGYDSVMVSDHFQPWRHSDGHSPFSFAWLGAAGARTSRVLLGTSVVSPSYRYHPAIVAQAMATLGHLYPGRALLGVGTGEALNEKPLGLEWPDQKERFARLKEACTLIRLLWTQERVTFEGNFFRTDRATIYDRPEEPIPLYIAASGPAAARLAGSLGDGFITTSGKGRELYVERLLPALNEGLQRSGRAPGEVGKMIEVKVSYDTDEQRALEDTRHWAALALTPEEKAGIDDPIEMERRASQLPLERIASRFIASNDPEEHARRLGEYIEMGFDHLVLHAPGPDQARFLRLYEQDVLPLVRERHGAG